jgi:hypothetical protein
MHRSRIGQQRKEKENYLLLDNILSKTEMISAIFDVFGHPTYID